MKHIARIAKKFTQEQDELKAILKLKNHPRLLDFAIKLSNRIDLLEKFITERTEYDGTKVGFNFLNDWKK